MPVTFSNIQEAKEYQKQILEDGLESYILHKDNTYSVHILGKIHSTRAKVIRQPSKWTEEGRTAEYDPEKEEIRFGKAANTTERVHEIGHLKLGHTEEAPNALVAAREEVDAQIYAYTKTGRPITYDVVFPALYRLEDEYKLQPEQSIAILKYALKEKGIELPEETERYWREERIK